MKIRHSFERSRNVMKIISADGISLSHSLASFILWCFVKRCKIRCKKGRHCLVCKLTRIEIIFPKIKLHKYLGDFEIYF
jgi:hypothetical protein